MTLQPTLSIGEFSRSTLLSARQLRDYHEAGLLLPARVDRWSGYRAYGVDQIEDAVLIRRLRELGVSLSRIRVVMGESGAAARLSLVAEELDTWDATSLVAGPFSTPCVRPLGPSVPAWSRCASSRPRGPS